ncbi:MAG: tetratricopeptide repeat protein [Verrucomicrobia bacterium]|nr:tetratricopeptide repeat protein [Verrucomicrobiota bacterium]
MIFPRITSCLLFLLLLIARLPAEDAKDADAKLWPPRGNNRPVVAASQSLWWNKNDPAARKLKARALDFAGRYAEAEQAALSALEVAPRDPEVQRILGRSLLHQGKLAAAKAALERAGEFGDHLSASLAAMLRPDRMSTAAPAPAISRALVQIQDERGACVGSGCFISEDGIVLTAAHVVAGRKRVLVRNALGKVFPVETICPGDFSADAVLLHTEAEEQMFLRLSEQEPRPGDPLFVVGFPLSLDLPLTSRGKVRSLPSAPGRPMLSTVPLVPGQSGSPVLDDQSRVVGIASRGSLAVKGGGAPARSEATPLSSLVHLRELSLQPKGFVDIRALPEWTEQSPFFDPAVSSAEQTVLDQDFEKAEKAISNALGRHPDDPGLYLRRAMVRIAWGHPSDAEADARLAAAYGPQDPEPRRFLCALLLSMGRREEAIPYLQEAYRLDPEDADTAEGLGELYLSSGKFDQALRPAEDATRISPDSVRAWSLLAAARLATGHTSEAREAAEMATTKGPEDPRAWIQLAACFNAAKDFPAAAMAAEQAIRFSPGDARAWLNLATARTGNNQFAQAVGYAERATQLEPSNRASWTLLAALYAELKRPDEAAAALAKAKSL